MPTSFTNAAMSSTLGPVIVADVTYNYNLDFSTFIQGMDSDRRDFDEALELFSGAQPICEHQLRPSGADEPYSEPDHRDDLDDGDLGLDQRQLPRPFDARAKVSRSTGPASCQA